eukprot:comp20434_c0_seq1/m.41077 comp20434_c0_seq1/g.41077  ORF comp20434_c0_seq1/g.41077 comp20434_c0_seq1/m.41077 type:complete len:362 (-) comp20434_c0_seq1:1373-2458(-)
MLSSCERRASTSEFPVFFLEPEAASCFLSLPASPFLAAALSFLLFLSLLLFLPLLSVLAGFSSSCSSDSASDSCSEPLLSSLSLSLASSSTALRALKMLPTFSFLSWETLPTFFTAASYALPFFCLGSAAVSTKLSAVSWWYMARAVGFVTKMRLSSSFMSAWPSILSMTWHVAARKTSQKASMEVVWWRTRPWTSRWFLRSSSWSKWMVKPSTTEVETASTVLKNAEVRRFPASTRVMKRAVRSAACLLKPGRRGGCWKVRRVMQIHMRMISNTGTFVGESRIHQLTRAAASCWFSGRALMRLSWSFEKSKSFQKAARTCSGFISLSFVMWGIGSPPMVFASGVTFSGPKFVPLRRSSTI